jgi:hypothetical protein
MTRTKSFSDFLLLLMLYMQGDSRFWWNINQLLRERSSRAKYFTVLIVVLFLQLKICNKFGLLSFLWWQCVGSHGILKQGNAEYDDKRQALYEYYHPLEFSPTIPIEEKTKLMKEWYVTLFIVSQLFWLTVTNTMIWQICYCGL